MQPSFLIRLSALWVLVLPMMVQGADTPSLHTVYRSRDGGHSWVRSDAGLPGHARINAFTAFGGLVFAGTDAGLFISPDLGQNWQPSRGMPAQARRILCFISLTNVLFAGTDGSGLLVCTDDGRTWSVLTNFAPRKVRCLLHHAGTLYAGTDADGVFQSKDGGKTWVPLGRGLPEGAQIFTLSAVQDQLFAGCYGKGLYSWHATEQAWVKKGRVSPLVLACVGGTLIAGHNPGGIFWSDDAGKTWGRGLAALGSETSPSLEFSDLAADAPIWELAADEELVVCGAANGIYYSNDRGHTWLRAQRGLPSSSPGVSFLVSKDLILAGTIIKQAAASNVTTPFSPRPGTNSSGRPRGADAQKVHDP